MGLGAWLLGAMVTSWSLLTFSNQLCREARGRTTPMVSKGTQGAELGLLS